MKPIEQLIFEKKFEGEVFDPNDFNDWAMENECEAYLICRNVANKLQAENATLLEYVEQLKADVNRLKMSHDATLQKIVMAVEILES